jgi:hypothetical protein
MKIKKYNITPVIIGISLVILTSPFSVFAQTVSSIQNANKTARLNTVNTNCQTATAQRLTSLSTIQVRIPTLKRLSSSQQQQFLGQVTTNISGLQGVQTQCTNDFNGGNLTNLINDYKSVFTTYRIYAEMFPQLNLLIASDSMGYTANNLTTLYAKLQTRVQQAGNPSNLTTLLADMNTKTSDAQTQYNAVESQISGLTPASYNSNPSGTTGIFQTARSAVKTGASDLQAAFADAKQIIQILKSMNSKSHTITPSISQ